RLAWIYFDLPDRGACIDNIGQGRLLEICRTLHRLDEIGDQIGATLVNILHLRPLGVHRLRKRNQRVVLTYHREGQDKSEQDEYTEAAKESFVHIKVLQSKD